MALSAGHVESSAPTLPSGGTLRAPEPLQIILQATTGHPAERTQPPSEFASNRSAARLAHRTPRRPVDRADSCRVPRERAQPPPASDDLAHVAQARAEKQRIVGRTAGGPTADPVTRQSLTVCFDGSGQRERFDPVSAARRTAVTSRRSPEVSRALLIPWDPELRHGDAPPQSTTGLHAPVIEYAVSPAECGVLVDIDDGTSGSHGQPALHAPLEGAPALGVFQVAERRAGEGTEGSTTVATAEALSS